MPTIRTRSRTAGRKASTGTEPDGHEINLTKKTFEQWERRLEDLDAQLKFALAEVNVVTNWIAKEQGVNLVNKASGIYKTTLQNDLDQIHELTLTIMDQSRQNNPRPQSTEDESNNKSKSNERSIVPQGEMRQLQSRKNGNNDGDSDSDDDTSLDFMELDLEVKSEPPDVDASSYVDDFNDDQTENPVSLVCVEDSDFNPDEWTEDKPRNNQGRRRNPIWKNYIRFKGPNGKLLAHCKVCKTKVSPEARRLRAHFSKCVLNESTGSETRTRRRPKNTENGNKRIPAGGGRRKGPIWEEFDYEVGDGKKKPVSVVCKICKSKVSPEARRLQNHFLKCVQKQIEGEAFREQLNNGDMYDDSQEDPSETAMDLNRDSNDDEPERITGIEIDDDDRISSGKKPPCDPLWKEVLVSYAEDGLTIKKAICKACSLEVSSSRHLIKDHLDQCPSYKLLNQKEIHRSGRDAESSQSDSREGFTFVCDTNNKTKTAVCKSCKRNLRPEPRGLQLHFKYCNLIKQKCALLLSTSTSQRSRPKSNSGRPSFPIWNEYIKGRDSNNKLTASCKLCGFKVSPEARRLLRHHNQCKTIMRHAQPTDVFIKELYNPDDHKKKFPIWSYFDTKKQGQKSVSNTCKQCKLKVNTDTLSMFKHVVEVCKADQPEPEALSNPPDFHQDESSPVMKRRVRYRDQIWKFFVTTEEGEKIVSSTCKNCDNRVSPGVRRMKIHMINCLSGKNPNPYARGRERDQGPAYPGKFDEATKEKAMAAARAPPRNCQRQRDFFAYNRLLDEYGLMKPNTACNKCSVVVDSNPEAMMAHISVCPNPNQISIETRICEMCGKTISRKNFAAHLRAHSHSSQS